MEHTFESLKLQAEEIRKELRRTKDMFIAFGYVKRLDELNESMKALITIDKSIECLSKFKQVVKNEF